MSSDFVPKLDDVRTYLELEFQHRGNLFPGGHV